MYYNFNNILTEIPVQIRTPLKDVTVPEKSTADFKCELNVSTDDITWYLGGNKLKHDPKKGVTIKRKGRELSLSLENVKVTDTGKVKVQAEDKTSEAQLTVTGVPAEFMKKPKDQTVMEKATAEFNIDLSQDVKPEEVIYI